MADFEYDFSVITACWNSADTLEECLESVRKQINVRAQHIVCDAVSNDGTPDILQRYKNADLTTIIEPDNGVYEAWNKCVQRIEGEWVIFLGSDDSFDNPTVLSELLRKIKMYNNQRLFYGQVRKETPQGLLIDFNGVPFKELDGSLDPPMRKLPPHPACVFHSSLFDEYPHFDASYKLCADSLHLGTIMKDVQPEFIPVVVTRFRTGGLTNSRERSMLKWREKRRVAVSLGYILPFPVIAMSYIRAVLGQLRS